MEVGIPDISSLERSFTSGRISLDDIKTSNNSIGGNFIDVKQQRVTLDLYNDQDDEREIMLLAMILLQLHGVKLPLSLSEDDNDLLNKKKRQRTSPDQLAILEQIFQTDKMPNQQTRVQLADQLGMSSRRVQIWFQNKRAKVKRSVSKHDGDFPDSPLSVLRQSSSSLSPLSSPSSPSASLEDDSPLLSPSPSPAGMPHITLFNQVPLQHMQPLPPTPIVLTSPTITTMTSTSSPTITNTTSILDNTTKQLKAQQLQFSRPPFDSSFGNPPLLAASY